MFKGLDDVKWDALWHAHGSARDVPDKLAALRHPETCEEACADLFETVWHQGTIYPASAAILPFLFHIIGSPQLPTGDRSPDKLAASLAAAIATGEGWMQRRIRTLGEEGAKAQMRALGRSFDEEIQMELDVLVSIQGIMKENRNLLERYKNEPEGLGEQIREALGL